jgi:hypothetical protein
MGVLCCVGCVDLTPPWEQDSAIGGAGGTSGSGGAGGETPDLGGTGGIVGTGGSVAGTGGSTGVPDSATDAPVTGTGGDTGGMDSGAGGAGGRIDSGADVDAPLLQPDAPPLGFDVGVDVAGLDLGAGGAGGTSGGSDAGPDLSTSPEAGALPAGLVAYYAFESALDNKLPDLSGNGNDGTLLAGATPDGGTPTPGFGFVPGKIGNGLALAQAGSGYVAMPTSVFAQAKDITIAAWVQVTTAQNWQRLFDVGINANLFNNGMTGTTYMNLVPQSSGSKVAFAISTDGYNNEQTLTGTAFSAKVWKHVAVVLSVGQGSLYVDGSLAMASSLVTLRPVDLGAIDYAYLGKSQFGADPYFDGIIDELRVYNRALSAPEVTSLYQYAGP